MRLLIIAFGLALMASPVLAKEHTIRSGNSGAQASASDANALVNDTDKLSYTIGVDLGTNFKKQAIQVNSRVLMRGLHDVRGGNKLLMTKKEMEATLKHFQQQMIAKRESAFKAKAKKNQQAGEAFLQANRSKEGVVVRSSGLQYKVITAGKGLQPSKTDTVTVEYTGRLLDGTVFDSTDKTGKPVGFKVTDVIPGWTEVLQLMHTGGTWEIYIPSKLAYGERGVGGPIGPNEMLIFKIHLISIKKNNNTKQAADTKKQKHPQQS